MHKYTNFTKWYHEIDGSALRSERLTSKKSELEAAFEAGRQLNEEFQDIKERLNTQDNQITSDPMFLVQEKKRITGVDLGYTDDYIYVDENNGYDEYTIEEYNDLDDPSDLVQVGYIEYWDFVTAFFTEKAAKAYIETQRHNLNEPRVYVASAYRNHEYNLIRKVLMV